jgi:lantibiotic modifying enzyme
VPGGGETASLMLGLAGIGYFYLRLHDPEGIPSVLIIRPPPGER